MTRKQQIEQAWLHGDAEQLTSFRLGAEWADEHPLNPWISVEDRLPEENKTVLLWLGGCYKVALLHNNQWWECTGYQIEAGVWSALDALSNPEVEHITHWMLIPKLK